MLENFDSLCEIRQKIIVSRDEGSSCRHRAHNKDTNLVRHYRIDGVVIINKGVKKCDYLLLNDEKKTAYLIELKGKDVLRAIEQLESTEQILADDLRGHQIYYRIVYHSNTHAIRTLDYTKFCKRKGGRVKAETGVIEEVI